MTQQSPEASMSERLRERERCAALCADEARIRTEAAAKHAAGTEAFDRCMAGARAAINCERAIRSGDHPPIVATKPEPSTPLPANAKGEAPLREALTEIHNWLVCWPIAAPDDMAQSFQHMEELAGRALGYVPEGVSDAEWFGEEAAKQADQPAEPSENEWQWETDRQDECHLPPAGWHCTRPQGHDGPCAAEPSTPASEPGELPPLPEPAGWLRGRPVRGYTSEQMDAHARAALAARHATSSSGEQRLRETLAVAVNALRSYQYGNGDPGLALRTANHCDAVLAETNHE